MRNPHQSSKARGPIMDIEKAFPNQQSIDAHFPDRTSTIIVGLDPSEAVTAAFCAVDPRDPVQVKNLTVKRSALYSPIMAHRTDLQWKKTLQGIADIEEPLPSSKLASAQECKERIQAVFRSYDDLFTFYSSKAWKRNDWERTKSFHAEKDWAVSGALNMVDKNRPCLFVVGSANFNTRTRLASLHDSFRGYFHLKATSMGYVVNANECYTSTKCPNCTAHGRDCRVAKPTLRSCICLHPDCQRWVHRDCLGAHNLALIGQEWIHRLSRPPALCRPPQPPQT